MPPKLPQPFLLRPPPRFLTLASPFSSNLGSRKKKYDEYGPPHPVSNVRPVRLHVPDRETPLHKRCRLLKLEARKFNHEFWAAHNAEFSQKKEAYAERLLKERQDADPTKTKLTAEEMSTFYREFLDSNRSAHVRYNIEWQRMNLTIAALSFTVWIQNIFKQ